MTRLPRRRAGSRVETVSGSVTTLELFVDLVFVFTITQLTATLSHDTGWEGAGRTVLLLVLMWWMYGGYAWLTNAAPPVTVIRRALLLVGMGGNFVMALAVPYAFTTDRVAFVVGYCIVVAVHAGMYLSQSTRVTPGMVLQLLVWNGAAALLIVAGAVVGGNGLYVLWLLAVFTETILPRLAARTPLSRLDSGPAFQLRPSHFVERHGLMLIIVLGESVLAIGVGVSKGVTAIGVSQIGFAAISLGLAASLYWAYFGTGEDEAAEESLTAASPERQQSVALWSYGYALAVMLLGVVFAASGLHHALAHPTARIDSAYAAHLGGGVAAFWVGLAGFRRAIGRPDAALRLCGGLILILVALLGARMNGLVELVALLAGSVTILLIEHLGRTPPHASGAAS
jgi:low temperature requirement protein LtrA